MLSNKFQMILIEKGVSHTEEFDAFIGIQIKGNGILLSIHEKGNFPDSFWRKLPKLMDANIEQGMESRKDAFKEVK